MSEWFSRQALGSLPADAARRWGAREALSFQGRRWTFAELSERVDRVARGLMGLGIAPGEHVALWMGHRPEGIDAAFAGLKLGAALGPSNHPIRAGDLPSARSPRRPPGAAGFSMPAPGAPGFSEGALPCHRIVRNLVARAFRLAITPADTFMMYLPLFHLFGFSEGMLMSMVTGARQILTETFDPPAILALMAEERPTILHGFDTHFKDLMEALDRSPRELWRVRTGICATGMPSSVPVARRVR